jgi:hypothetical protein
MTTPTVKLNASAIGGVIQTANSGNVSVQSDGTITVNAADVPALLAAGCTYVQGTTRFYTTPVAAPAVANVNLLYSSAALSNGTLAVAAQPDVPRQAQAIVIPGTLAVTAGVLTLTYVANDGTTTVDALSVVTAASTTLTVFTTKGVVTMTSQVLSAVAGGVSPTIQIGTNGVLAVPINPNDQDVTLIREYNDGAAATQGTIAAFGLVTPHVAPNGTHTFTFGYTTLTPGT